MGGGFKWYSYKNFIPFDFCVLLNFYDDDFMYILQMYVGYDIYVSINLYSCSVFIVRNGSLSNMFTSTSCVFTFYADHSPPNSPKAI